MSAETLTDAKTLTDLRTFNIPGGAVVVEYVRPDRFSLASAWIVAEPFEPSPAKTTINDAVKLLSALRDVGRLSLLRACVDADRTLAPYLSPALVLSEAHWPHATAQKSAVA